MFPLNTVRIHLTNDSTIDGRIYTVDENTGLILISKVKHFQFY